MVPGLRVSQLPQGGVAGTAERPADPAGLVARWNSASGLASPHLVHVLTEEASTSPCSGFPGAAGSLGLHWVPGSGPAGSGPGLSGIGPIGSVQPALTFSPLDPNWLPPRWSSCGYRP